MDLTIFYNIYIYMYIQIEAHTYILCGNWLHSLGMVFLLI